LSQQNRNAGSAARAAALCGHAAKLPFLRRALEGDQAEGAAAARRFKHLGAVFLATPETCKSCSRLTSQKL